MDPIPAMPLMDGDGDDMFIPDISAMDGDGEATVMPLIPPMPLMEGDGDADGMFMPVMPWRRPARTWSGV